ncbi:unnamed protein product [Hydatigera taeniaeformis]|uniref:Myb-like domain-containing protein n=1 Tax=Hydatigena taeniaeformis TaxID=6205 RepID=A0A0R3WR84_HYDTA|nr:unnamed protein product [Hydatigera taeniaeformis]
MDVVISTFLSDVFEQEEPNLEKFRVDVKVLHFWEMIEFGAVLLYVETLMLSSLMKTYQDAKRNASPECITQTLDRARAVLLQMDSQASFLAKSCSGPSTNTIRLSINCMGSYGHEHHLVEEKVLTSWRGALDVFHPPLSVATQTDTTMELQNLPQSTPNKNCQVRRLLPRGHTNLPHGLCTPPDSPTETLPKLKVSKKARNLSLTLRSCDQNDAASIAMEGRARRRKPWTLSETLALWHAVQLAIPGPPSWAKIRDEVFPSSRRTNVDLKDRWRVIMRDPTLQTYVRQYYEKWLASRNPT